ncbi:MAG: phosphatidate cytidylyltransferase [Elusimicrobia bacterium]|nr:phosphatidate cytidylyltransferase [Elusimicrobiota bacterium]
MTGAWQSDVYRFYLVFVGGILAFAGAALCALQFGLRKDVSRVWAIYRGWLIMLPLVFGCLALGRAATIVFVIILSASGFKEFARATGLYADWGLTGVVYAAIAALGVVALVPDPNTGSPGWYGLFMTMPVYTIALLPMLPILRNQPAGQIQPVSLAVVGFVYCWLFCHLAFLANGPHAYGYFMFLVVAVELNDVSAFTFGKLFGRHPLRSNISPNKTWEGALGALAVSLALPWLLRRSFPHFGPLQLVLTGVIVGVGAPLGDLSLGFIKRDLGIKDMGAAIPGHGGVLDRINSLLYTSPFFMHMADYFYKHW